MEATLDTESTHSKLTAGHSDGVPSTLVVPVDGSDFSLRALPIASEWAQRFDADVIAVTTPMTLDNERDAQLPVWLEEFVTDDRYPCMRAMVSEETDPLRAVAALVEANTDSMVCMATHARGALGTAALGNVAQQVVREVGVPVLLVGRHCAEEQHEDGPIVVCHDGSPAADAILETARAWAQALGLPIVLVHVFHPLDVATAENPTAAVASAVDFLGPDPRAEVLASSFPTGAMRDLAHELDASLIALSTHGRSGVARVVMGSVASWVTRESPCPVLATRPGQLAERDEVLEAAPTV